MYDIGDKDNRLSNKKSIATAVQDRLATLW